MMYNVRICNIYNANYKTFFVHIFVSTFISLTCDSTGLSLCCRRLCIFPSCGDEVLGAALLCWAAPGTGTWNMAIQGWFCRGFLASQGFEEPRCSWKVNKEQNMWEQTMHTAYRFTFIAFRYTLWPHINNALSSMTAHQKSIPSRRVMWPCCDPVASTFSHSNCHGLDRLIGLHCLALPVLFQHRVHRMTLHAGIRLLKVGC